MNKMSMKPLILILTALIVTHETKISMNDDNDVEVENVVFFGACLENSRVEISTYALLIHSGMPDTVETASFSASINNERGEEVILVTCSYDKENPIVGDAFMCPIEYSILSAGKYYISLINKYEDPSFTILEFNLSSTKFEVSNNNLNSLYTSEPKVYYSYHGAVEKDDYINLQFSEKFTNASNIPTVTLQINDSSSINLQCSINEYDASLLSCLIAYNSSLVDIQLLGKVSTECTGLYDSFITLYKNIYTFIKITDFQQSKTCLAVNKKLSFNVGYTNLEGEISVNQSINDCIKVKSGNVELTATCTSRANYILECTTPTLGNEGNYSLILPDSCLSNEFFIIKPYMFEDIVEVNKNYVNPSGNVNQTINYESVEASITIGFTSEVTVPPTVILGNKTLTNCNPTGQSSLQCSISFYDFAPSSQGNKKFTGKIINACGLEESTVIEVTITSKVNVTIVDGLAESKCIFLDDDSLSFDLNYVISNDDTDVSNFELTLEKVGAKDTNIRAICQASSNQVKCDLRTDEIKSSGYYYAKISDHIFNYDYIIYPFTSKNLMFISSKKKPKSLEEVIKLEAKFSSKNEEKQFSIKFNEELESDFLPKVIINDIQLNCSLKDDKTYLYCKINSTDFPYDKNQGYTEYNGTIIDYCGNEGGTIIFKSVEDKIKGMLKNKALVYGILIALAVIIIIIVACLIRCCCNKKKKLTEEVLRLSVYNKGGFDSIH